MDFEAAARCYNELKQLRERAGGALHDLQGLTATSEQLSESDKTSLEDALSKVIPTFGVFDEAALVRVHTLLMNYEAFAVAWLVECLSGNDYRSNF